MNINYDLLMLRIKKISIIFLNTRFIAAFLKHGVVAGVEHASILRRGFSTIVDIGANNGQFALAARGFSNAKVYSFEPLPEATFIYKKLFRNDPFANVYTSAIGSKSEKRLMNVSKSNDSSSLLEAVDAQVDLYPDTAKVGSLMVDVRPLDWYLSKSDLEYPALLKLDVQGFEYEVLLGCEKYIACFDYIYCECSFVELYKGQKLAFEIIKFLSDHCFQLVGTYNVSYGINGESVQSDLLFKRVGSEFEDINLYAKF